MKVPPSDMTEPLALTTHFSSLAGDYDLVLCDIWGVVHNGIERFAEACDALMRFRAQGAGVILITNAPRPGDVVARQLAKLKVPPEVYDGVVSSGDVTRAVILSRPGQSIFHLGPERDRSIFTGLDAKLVPLEQADYVVCSGLFDDDVETPQDYRQRLEIMRERRLFMLCGNPDVVVERGRTLVYCAGSIADLYATMGGEVFYAGKPYRPIYHQALDKAKAAGVTAAPGRVLAIGDSIRTDLKGAHAFGVDFLFVTSGIHTEELGRRDNPDMAALQTMLTAAGAMPKAVMRRLVW
jgi:HAD superfamily hydrolase (TIGR01459 family)